ncbi:hypothetical protein [Antrihabitans stalactiti]|nr:hypothetical protein [Antrihabitans stalactiti]
MPDDPIIWPEPSSLHDWWARIMFDGNDVETADDAERQPSR